MEAEGAADIMTLEMPLEGLALAARGRRGVGAMKLSGRKHDSYEVAVDATESG